MKGRELLLIAISSFILTAVWIASNVYHAYATSTLDSLLQVQILPISPSFDKATISKLNKRTPIEPLTGSAISPTPTIEITPTPEITVVPLPTEEPIIPLSDTPVPTETIPISATPTP